jgi:hypothetical protein
MILELFWGWLDEVLSKKATKQLSNCLQFICGILNLAVKQAAVELNEKHSSLRKVIFFSSMNQSIFFFSYD